MAKKTQQYDDDDERGAGVPDWGAGCPTHPDEPAHAHRRAPCCGQRRRRLHVRPRRDSRNDGQRTAGRHSGAGGVESATPGGARGSVPGVRKTVCVLVVVMATQIYQFVNFILKKEEGCVAIMK